MTFLSRLPTLPLIFILLISVFSHLLTLTTTIHAKDYSTYNLPEGALMRLGKGRLIDAKFFYTVDKLAILTNVGVWIHDSNTGEELTFLIEDYHEPKNFDISSDDSMIAIGTLQGNILVWDLTSEKVLVLVLRECW